MQDSSDMTFSWESALSVIESKVLSLQHVFNAVTKQVTTQVNKSVPFFKHDLGC